MSDRQPRALIHYTNWRGETKWRSVQPAPGSLRFAASPPWHPNLQWLVDAYVLEDGKAAVKTFAMDGVREWRSD